jgi:WS/DGAT/MGAT family acyltransferase
VRRLTAIDAQFLYAEDLDRGAPTHTLKVSIIGPNPTMPYSYELAKEQMRARIGLLPPFRWRLVETPFALHHPVWIEDPDFDLEWHVRRMGCPAPGSERELCELISDIASRPLERSHPLWELWVIEGLALGRIATVAKVHHALADGVASAELLNQVFDHSPTPEPPPEDTWSPEPVPPPRTLALAAARDVARLLATGLPTIVRLSRRARAHKRIAGLVVSEQPPKLFQAPPTPFNRQLTPHRSFAIGSFALADVRAVKAAFGATVNDVVLAVAAGALRRYLIELGGLPDAPLVGGMPVSVRTDAERGTWGNRIVQIYVALPTDVADPRDRLTAARRASSAAKADLEATRGARLENWLEYLPLPVLKGIGRLFMRQIRSGRAPNNLTISNVPGPREPLYLDGAPVESFFSVGPLMSGTGLNVTAWSYVDQLNVVVLGCREITPDIWRLVELLRDELEILVALAADESANVTSSTAGSKRA